MDSNGFVFLVIGIGAIGYSVYLFIESYQLVQRSILTVGTVTRLEREQVDELFHYSAIVTFQTHEGKHIHFKSKPLLTTNYGNWPNFVQGQFLIVRYDPDAPQKAIVNSFLHLWFPPAMMCVIGIAALVAAFFRLV